MAEPNKSQADWPAVWQYVPGARNGPRAQLSAAPRNTIRCSERWVMLLQRQAPTSLHHDAPDLVTLAHVDRLIRTPRPMHIEKILGHFWCDRLELHQPLQPVGILLRRHQQNYTSSSSGTTPIEWSDDLGESQFPANREKYRELSEISALKLPASR
jgi:hypothetical protein